MLLRIAALAMFILFEVLFVIPMAENNSAFACSCAGPKPARETYQESNAVFVGRAVNIENEGRFNIVQFEVGMAWKGVSDDTAFVETADSGSMCGYGFEQGRDYLVYAYSGSDYLSAGACGRTQPFETAFQDLAYLGPGYIPTPGQPIVEREPAGPWLMALLVGVAAGAAAFVILKRTRN